jgi:two-component system alkaline phosphatase synthesis response regulator PhoP
MIAPKRILVIEDELEFAELVKARLEMAGYMVSIAIDAYGGTQTIIKENIDLIVLDLMMPAGGGMAVLERLRKFPTKSTIPVVVLTGKTIDDTLNALLSNLNVSAVFTKPYDAAEFLTKIELLLNP